MTHPLWQPPILHTKWHERHGEERKVGWLELFYDLVYVATLIQLGNRLSDDVSVTGFVHFVLLFIPIWWSWTGVTFYVNRYVVDDVPHRILIFFQILGIATLGLSIAGAFEDLTNQFAGSYIFIRLIMIVLYMRAGHHIPEARNVTNHFARGFAFALVFWIISLFVPAPLKFLLWGIGMFVDITVPFTMNKETRSASPPDIPHMSERYGIFTIIVLGESFVKILDEAAGQAVGVWAIVWSVFGVAVVSCLWWLYFDDVVDQVIKGKGGIGTFVWVYSHLPFAIGLTAFGVAAKKVFIQPHFEPLTKKYMLLYVTAIIIYLISIALIDLVTEREDEDELDNLHRAYWRFGAAAAVLAIGIGGYFVGMTSMIFIILIAAVFIIQVWVDLPERASPQSLS